VFNDSGPILLLFATFLAACVVLYVRGDARLGATPDAPDEPLVRAVPAPESPVDAGLGSARPDPAPTAR
jgi:hypothetical protein